jgi:hypothetical protein
VHFVTQVPLPRSVTRTVYDIAKEDPKFSTQISYIDTVRLAADMKRLLPLTAFYAPNAEWEGKVTRIEDIAKTVLESHMFEKLLWCDTIRSMKGSAITSLNNRTWEISINDAGFPCFDTYEEEDGQTKRACITKCDIIARNGIVHELDTLLLFNAAETRPPSSFTGSFPTAGTPAAPSPPTVFQRPSQSSLTNDDTPAAAPSVIDFGAGKQSSAIMVQSYGATIMLTLLVAWMSFEIA